jgi:hypothetical protein
VNESSPSGKRRQQTPAFLSQTRFAKHVDVSRVTVWRWIRAGKLRTVQLTPSVTRVPLTEVERMAHETAGKRPSPRRRRGAGQQNDDPRDDDLRDDLTKTE